MLGINYEPLCENCDIKIFLRFTIVQVKCVETDILQKYQAKDSCG